MRITSLESKFSKVETSEEGLMGEGGQNNGRRGGDCWEGREVVLEERGRREPTARNNNLAFSCSNK